MEKFLHKTGPWCQEVLRWLIYTMEYYAAERKKKDFLLCDSMDGTGDNYAKWNKQVSERQISYDLTYERNLMNKIN